MACARAGGGWAVVAAPTTDDDAIIIIEEGQASALERSSEERGARSRVAFVDGMGMDIGVLFGMDGPCGGRLQKHGAP